MIEQDGFGGTDGADVGVISLGDRRRIKELETLNENLERRLAVALGQLKPGMERKHGECYHSGRFTVADRTPEVTCNDCGAVVDPYTVLRKIALREINFCFSFNSLQSEKTRLDAEVKKLRETKSRVKRQVRGAKDMPIDGVAKALADRELHGIGVVRQHDGRWTATTIDRYRRQHSEKAADAQTALQLALSAAETKTETETG